MARSRETKIELTAYDDLFQTDESRAEAKLSKIRDIPLSQIDEFPDHPFKVLMDGKLVSHLNAIDDQAHERKELLTRQMQERKGINEALKARDQMAWVGAMNNIRNAAEEIVLSELIYC